MNFFEWSAILNLIFHPGVVSREKRNAEKANKKTRNVSGYTYVDIPAVLTPESYDNNMVISGQYPHYRTMVLKNALWNCACKSRPVIVLHQGNTALESFVSQKIPDSVIINSTSKQFDPFKDFELWDINKILMDVAGGHYNLNHAFQRLMNVVYELKMKQATSAYKALTTCDLDLLYTVLDSKRKRNQITVNEYNKLNADLLNSQGEIITLSSLVWELKNRLSGIVGYTGDPHSILSAVQAQKIMLIDLKAATNDTVRNLIFSSLALTADRGCQFSLVLDNVPFINNQHFINFITNIPTNVSSIISADDYYSTFNNKQELYTTIRSRATKVFLFQHSDNNTCEKWADYFGKYDKIEVVVTSGGLFMPDKIDKRNIKEYRILPTQIMNLKANQAIIYNANAGVNGNSNELMETDKINDLL